MKNRIFILVLILLLTVVSVAFAGGRTEAAAPAKASPGAALEALDFDTLVSRAKAEGKLVAYAPTSRLPDAAKVFTAKYGIQVETQQLSEVEMIERTYREATSGIHAVDMVLIEDWPVARELLVDTGYLYNYIPPSAKANTPPEYQNPLGFVFNTRIIGFNTEAYKQQPITSLWDLTLPEWKSKLMIRDPAITGEHQNFFAEVIRRSDEMAADYQKKFGKPLQLTEANAGLEWIKRLAMNDVIIMSSDTRISEAVGKKGQTDPPLGLFYVLSHHRHIPAKNLALDYAVDVTPFAGYAYGMYAQIATNAKNPHAAALFIEFLNTPEGYAAWAGAIGFYPVNTSLQQPEDRGRTWEGYWKNEVVVADAQYAIENRGMVLDNWVKWMQQ